MKNKEVLDRIESACDRVKQASHAVSNIVIKHG